MKHFLANKINLMVFLKDFLFLPIPIQ